MTEAIVRDYNWSPMSNADVYSGLLMDWFYADGYKKIEGDPDGIWCGAF